MDYFEKKMDAVFEEIDNAEIDLEEKYDAWSEALDATIHDLVVALLWEDRKDDEDLPLGAIEELVAAGRCNLDLEYLGGIIYTFGVELHKRFGSEYNP